MRVKMVTTLEEECGITTYTSYLTSGLSNFDDLDIQLVENKLLERNPLHYLKMARESKSGDPDVVHAQHEFGLFGKLLVGGPYAYIYYPFLFGDSKVITTFHEVESLESIRTRSGFVEWLGKKGRRFLSWPVFNWSDCIIVHNERARDILENIGVNNVRIIPHGVVVRKPANRTEARKHLGFKDDRKIVTIFGFINRFKGHDRVVRQIDKLEDDVLLYIAGKSSPISGATEYKDKLSELAREKDSLNKIKFHGYVKEEEMPYVFGSSDLMVFPYRHITESGAMSIAFGFGRPVLASDLPPFKDKPIEICKDDNWAERINNIVHDGKKLREMEKNSKKYAEENRWENVAGKTVEVYKEVLGK